MPQTTSPCGGSLIPEPPISAGLADQQKRLSSLMDGTPKSEAAVASALESMDELLDRAAATLYNLASMLVGEGEESIALIEKAVATAEVSHCEDPEQARIDSLFALCRGAAELLEKRNPGCLAAPVSVEHIVTCLDDDDLESAGIKREVLDRMFAGPERERVRTWLESLSTATRTIFVMRAVGGVCNPNTARLLNEATGATTVLWTPEAVSEIFRQGLCSLATQLLQASAVR